MPLQTFEQATPQPGLPKQASTNPSPGGGTGPSFSPADSFPALFPIVLGSAFILGLALAFLILWVTRRRRKKSGGGGGATAGEVDGIDGDEAVLLSAHGSSRAGSAGGGSFSRCSREGFGGLFGISAAAGDSGRRRLQKACSVGAGVWPATKGAGAGEGRRGRHVSMPLIPRACSKGHFHFGVGGGGEGCRWPGEEGVVERRKAASWIDEDALHGPQVKAVSQPPGGRKKGSKANRGSWPLRNRAPTLPRIHHTIHGYPYTMSGGRDGGSSEALLGEKRAVSTTGVGYAQLRAFSSSALPEPPKPALVANRDKRVIRPSVTMGYVYGVSRIPQPVLSPPTSPTRPSPMTPTRPRGRQRSTDSTLSDILRSTEKRLREGSVSETIRIRRVTSSPVRTTTSGEPLGPRELVVGGSRSRTPSPQKTVSGEPFTSGHARQESQQSASSEADSLVGQELSAPDVPLGLTSPSRAQKKPEAEQPLLKEQSARTSLSSELSTLYSEDEMPEEVKRAIMPFEGLVVQPQRAANVRRPSMNDPFVVAPLSLSVPRAASTGAWPTKQSKSQDLLRPSMQQSQRLRSMTIGHGRPQSQGLILAPGPVVHTAPRSSLQPVISPPSRRVSVTIPRSIQPYIASRASEPPPSPTRLSPSTNSPTGPLFLRVTKTSTLSTIPLLPPPSAPTPSVLREPNTKQPAPIKLSQTTANHPPAPRLLLPSTERSSAPSSPTRRGVGGELRLSLGLPPRYLTDAASHRASASSSVYSQHDPSSTTQAPSGARELNRAGFQANSSLYPAPLSGPAGIRLVTSDIDPCEGGGGETEGDDQEDEDTPLAVTTTIASLRRMNSGVSTASSLRSIADRGVTPSPSPSVSPQRALGSAGRGSVAVSSSPTKVGEGVEGEKGDRRSTLIGARNYFIMGGGAAGGAGQRQSRRVSRGVVKSPSGGAGVGGTGSGGGSPHKRRLQGSVHRQRRASAALLRTSEEEGKENHDGGFKVAAGEFTFEVSNPHVSSPGKGGVGLRESSSGSLNTLLPSPAKDAQRLSLAWKPVEGSGGGFSRTGSPVRAGGTSPSRMSLRSAESLGMYDRQGFLIAGSPVRAGTPSGVGV